MSDEHHRYSLWDLLAVSVAAAITAGSLVYLNTDNSELVVKEVPVTVVPASCAQALDIAARTVADAGDLLAAANQIAPLLQDVYDAGLAEAPIAPKVKAWSDKVEAAYADADTAPDRFDLLAQKCRAERTLP